MEFPVGIEVVDTVARLRQEQYRKPTFKGQEKEKLVKKVMKERPDLRRVWRFRNQEQTRVLREKNEQCHLKIEDSSNLIWMPKCPLD